MVPLIKIPDRGIPYQTLLALQTFSPPIFTENLISLKTLRVLREINIYIQKVCKMFVYRVIRDASFKKWSSTGPRPTLRVKDFVLKLEL